MSREAISDDSLKQLKNRLMCEAQHLISDIRKEQKKFIDVSINETCQNVEPIEVIELLSRRILTTQTKKKLHFQWGSDCRHILASQDEGGVSYWDAYGSCKEAIFGSEDKWICSCSISPNCSFACYGYFEILSEIVRSVIGAKHCFV
ncbi:hypothetical protein A3Q56_06196 [Intoshia linei]|uniref:Uncharacterized protein n=1 Tax=Intoshia linei TaxID=1819745 RepID=A0A177AX55_9BILA|nr:hypothetical protein A3Q56_06196 [Intoshia linei]